jgi:SAM-dependent methyltransferase
MRAEHWRWFEKAFPAGSNLLELGSGTGIEASRLAANNYKVALLDVSAKMLEVAAARVLETNPTALLGTHNLPASRVGELVLLYGEGAFGGAYSSFGPLNCEPDLTGVAKGLARLVRPGGKLVFSVMPRFCLTEIAWFGLHGELKNATRRLRGPVMARALPGDELLVKTYYYNPGEFTRQFLPYFKRNRLKAFPLLWPPPYLSHLPPRFPRLFGALDKADNALSNNLPFLAAFGDHFLIELERV